MNNNLSVYIQSFFKDLEVSSDNFACFVKESLCHAILTFLKDESKENAFAVYELFFGIYRIVPEGSKNPFIDLLDMLNAYEERAATLINKQRDHFIHSVNIFILGLCIYAKNANYRKAFDSTVKSLENYPLAKEEFLFRWGLASLFHDVGYPLEIISRQIEEFLQFATDADHDHKKGKIKAHLEFGNFRRLNSVAEVVPKKDFIKDFYDKNESSVYIDLLQPVDLLAQKIHLTLGVPLDDTKNKLDTFTDEMAKNGFIDHGFYSAVIILKWYGYQIQVTGDNPSRFYGAIVDSAGAILLHNYYRFVLKKQFGLDALDAKDYPLAWLLILCDELQDWNRAGYGKIEKYRTAAAAADIKIDNNLFSINYLAKKGILKNKFTEEKQELFNTLLDIPKIFRNGLDIRCDTLDEAFIEAKNDYTVPRPVLENMELLAREIHDDYIQKQKSTGAPIFVAESYDDLEPSVRYSNLRQAMNMDKKLRMLGYALVALDYDAKALEKLPARVMEQFAVLEHNDWVKGKEKYGWKYAPIRDDSKRLHNCLVPWNELSKSEQEKDRDTAKNIIKLAKMAQMKVIKL